MHSIISFLCFCFVMCFSFFLLLFLFCGHRSWWVRRKLLIALRRCEKVIDNRASGHMIWAISFSVCFFIYLFSISDSVAVNDLSYRELYEWPMASFWCHIKTMKLCKHCGDRKKNANIANVVMDESSWVSENVCHSWGLFMVTDERIHMLTEDIGMKMKGKRTQCMKHISSYIRIWCTFT